MKVLITLFLAALVVSVFPAPGRVSALEVGDKAPDFELPSTEGGQIKLADFAGKKDVVLLFYPMDFTPT